MTTPRLIQIMRRTRTLAAILLPCCFALLIGCYDQAEGEFARLQDDGSDRLLGTRLVAEGKIAYETHCIGCHGAEGDGLGDAAVFLNPKPRNFKQANYKFSSVKSGQLPLDEDLKRSIRQGLKGSAMPAFGELSDHTLDALVAYLKTFSPRWEESDSGQPIPVVDDTYRFDDDRVAAIKRGEVIYHAYASCWSCHPAYVDGDTINEYRRDLGFPEFIAFRDDMHLGVGKDNVEGQLIYPPDFKRDFVRAGADAKTLYRSIAGGISGTAMPTWVGSMAYNNADGEEVVSETDLWAMAYYVEELIRQRPKKLDDPVESRDHRRPIYLHGAPPKTETTDDTSTDDDAAADEIEDIEF